MDVLKILSLLRLCLKIVLLLAHNKNGSLFICCDFLVGTQFVYLEIQLYCVEIVKADMRRTSRITVMLFYVFEITTQSALDCIDIILWLKSSTHNLLQFLGISSESFSISCCFKI